MNWTHIIVHHSATKDGRVNDWEAIKRYHMSYRIDGTSVTVEEFERRLLAKEGKRFERPWHDIGYHLGIELVGDSYQVMIGRSLEEAGAHTVGMNAVAIGICCVGDYDLAPPPEPMVYMLVELLKELCFEFSIPVENIRRHSEYANKTCPGEQFNLEAVKERVQA